MFCNPPYGRAIGEWVKKGYEESQKPGTVVVMLIPARTDTAYFHDYIFHGKADEVRFLRGRLKFTDEDGNAKDAAPFPSAVIVWRSPDKTGKRSSWTFRDGPEAQKGADHDKTMQSVRGSDPVDQNAGRESDPR